MEGLKVFPGFTGEELDVITIEELELKIVPQSSSGFLD